MKNYDIQYDEHTGYYVITDGTYSYGEYLTYEDARRELTGNYSDDEQFDDIDNFYEELKEELKEEEYVVFRAYKQYGTRYLQFLADTRDKYVRYSEDTTYERGFNDRSISTFTRKEAYRLAREFTNHAIDNGWYDYQRWEAKKKWW